MKTFTQIMQEQRATQGMTLDQLAPKVGFHPSYLSLVERGKRTLEEAGVYRVALALGVDPGEALLAALRERLPEALRVAVPARLPEGPETIHQGMRSVQASQLDYEVDLIRVDGEVDWDGNLRIVRHLEDVRPNADGRHLWEMVFQERVHGAGTSKEKQPGLTVLREPNVKYELKAAVAEETRYCHLVFPNGWRRVIASARGPQKERDEPGFSFELESFLKGAYALDITSLSKRVPVESLRHPLQGSFNVAVLHHARRLEVRFHFPSGYSPDRWEHRVWWGMGSLLSSASQNLAGRTTSKSWELSTESNVATLVVEEPLAGYTFAIVFIPASRQKYLEARHANEQKRTKRKREKR